MEQSPTTLHWREETWLCESRLPYVNTTLKNALYVPSFPQSIFSVQAATAKGVSVIFEPDHAELVYKNGTVFHIQKHGKLTSDSVNYACDLSSWHAILGHCNYDDVLKLEKYKVLTVT